MRPLRSEEIPLVKHLLEEAGITANVESLTVKEMSDGKMGSLLFTENKKQAAFGKQVSEYSFEDADGVLVSATLNLDQNGNLFELDVWKVDFSSLVQWPEFDEISK